MKTLSAANQANINNRVQAPVIKIDLANQSKKWSYGVATGYDPIVSSISVISHTIDSYGGLGEYASFSFSIQKEPTQIIQTDNLDNEPVTVNIAYGTDPDIPIIAGVIDDWKYSKDELTIKCISKLVLKGTKLPIQQINATNYSTFNIPDGQIGKWVPFTIGTPYRPIGLQGAFGANASAKYIFNAPVTGHIAIGVFPGVFSRFYLWNDSAKRWLEETNSTGVEGGDLTAGYIGVRTDAQAWTKNVQPLDAAWALGGASTGGSDSDPEKAINGSTSDFALLDNPAPDATTTGGNWTGTIPDLSFGSGHQISTIYFKGKVQKEQALNHGTRTGEVFRFGIEVVPGTAPDLDQKKAILVDTETAFNNVDGADNDTDLALITLNYSDVLGDELGGNSVTFPIEKLANLILFIECLEEDQAGAGDESDFFRIYEAGLNLLCNVAVFQYKQVSGELSGYDDDGSGTYTGSANSLIETPSDVIHFILGEVFGIAGFDTTSISTARIAFGTYIISGQILNLTSGEESIFDIMSNSRMSAWIDYEGNWKVKYWDLPGATPDKTFSQENVDFADEEIEFVGQSTSENVFNQFELLYGWNEAEGRFNDVLILNESTAGAIGTWLTDSQADYNITRKMTVEARWINDANTATSFGNYLIYRYADRKRIVRFKTAFNGFEMELLDRVKLNHQEMTDTDESGGGDHVYEIYSVETDIINGVITFEAMQADTSHAALTDPT